jgi:hypothetical protein
MSAALAHVQSAAPVTGGLTGALQRKCDCAGGDHECEDCKQHRLQRRPSTGAAQALAPPIVHEVLHTSGQPLDPATQAFMESRFGHDFGRVRVHTGTKASDSALAVDALAYTVGRNVVFREGYYRPETEQGRKILAHELTHVVQQGAAGPSARAAKLEVGAPGDRYEREAEQLSEAIVRTPDLPGPMLASRSAAALQRYEVPGNLPCRDVVGWLDSNSPYRPEWAQTACEYSFNGQVRVSPPRKVGTGVQVTVIGGKSLSVDVDCPVDRPEWTPSPRPNGDAEQAAWIRMRAVLDKHEREHQAIGRRFRPTIEKQFQAVNFVVAGSDAADATAKAEAKLQEEQREWVDAAQKAQSSIDPFREAVLRCPPTSTELEEFAPAPEYIGPTPAPAQSAGSTGALQRQAATDEAEATEADDEVHDGDSPVNATSEPTGVEEGVLVAEAETSAGESEQVFEAKGGASKKGGAKPGPKPAAPKNTITKIDVDLTDQEMTVTWKDGTVEKRKISSGKGQPNTKDDPCTTQKEKNCTPAGTFQVGKLGNKDTTNSHGDRMGWFVGLKGDTGPEGDASDRGIGIHNSQPVPGGPASHGCIRVGKGEDAMAFAKKVNGGVVRGETVITVSGKAPTEPYTKAVKKKPAPPKKKP